MGNVLIVLDDDHETFLRRLTQDKYGSKKGSISRVIQEALDELMQKGKKESAKRQFLQTIEKGLNLGFKGRVYGKREELYE